MKKLSILLTILAAAATVQAQTEMGNIAVGASTNLSFNSTSFGSDSDNTTGFSIGTNTGYFLVDNFAMGLLFDFSTSSIGDFSTSTTAIGPFARYYIQNTFATIAYQHSFLGVKIDGDKSTSDGGQVSFQLGYAFFLNDFVSIEPSLNYTLGTGELLDEISTFSLDVGFALYF